ncbi:MAG: hypothetical protein M3450_18540, partial [Actinomycetota bacterium]|nr:hypothetical protein [Actinomycetota bacterium]
MPTMDEERSTGGYGWSTVGQLAPDRTQPAGDDAVPVGQNIGEAAPALPESGGDQDGDPEGETAGTGQPPHLREFRPGDPPRDLPEADVEAAPAPPVLAHGLEAVVADEAVTPSDPTPPP